MIANIIDRGYNFEIRVEPIKKIEKEKIPDQTAIAKIQELTQTLEFMKLEGPPILTLPEPPFTSDQVPDQSGTPSKAAERKKKKV
jgi:hypothetical protein